MKTLLITLLSLSLFITACASKKPGNGQDGAQGADGDGLSLQLNGDSDSGKAGGLQTVFFALDSSTLDSRSKETLKNNAEFLKKHPRVSIQIEGHADERGGRQYNLALGERRAKAVRDYLNTLGIKNDRLSIISYGNERPLAEGHDESAWSQNRRGNFVVTSL